MNWNMKFHIVTFETLDSQNLLCLQMDFTAWNIKISFCSEDAWDGYILQGC